MYISLSLYIYRDSRLNRPESVSIASLARQLDGIEEWRDEVDCTKTEGQRGEMQLTEN